MIWRATMRTILLLCSTFLLNISYSYEVLTISDSIVDHILKVDEEFVHTIPGKKGGSALVDHILFQQIINESGAKAMIRPGASAVNMIKGLQQLGDGCALITTIGKDTEGEFFLSSLRDLGINLFLETSDIPTGKSACLVTPNGERTMRTFLGASRENDRLCLSTAMFEGISHFHLEGYQLFHHKLVREAVALAKNNGATVSLDLSSFEVVRINKDFIWELLDNHAIDILFANQEEALALTGLAAKEASELLGRYCSISVVTMGEKGCYTNQGGKQWQCKAFNVEVVDTIGAGDLFISGFLHGFLHNQPIPVCASWGTLLASHVVQVLGAEIPQERWIEIKKTIASEK